MATRRLVFLACAMAVTFQSVRNFSFYTKTNSFYKDWQVVPSYTRRTAETKTLSNPTVAVDVHNTDTIETIFVVVVSMQRSSSTFLSHQVLTGLNHSKADSPINHSPPMSPCPLRHFITLNEIFTPHPQQSGDAWTVEGADYLVKDGTTTQPKDLSVEQLTDFLRRVAQRRCREQIDRDIQLFDQQNNNNNNDERSTKTQLLAQCPHDLKHHQCAVSYKHFDFHLPFDKDNNNNKPVQIWAKLLPNLRMVILERKIEDRWSSYWVAKQTGDWNVHGTEDHKVKLAELKQKVPAVPDWFRREHNQWYQAVRSSLYPGQLLSKAPRLDLGFDYVVSKPLEVRKNALTMIWDGVTTGSFANCSNSRSAAVEPPNADNSLTVSCKTFHYKLVEETFRNAGSLYVGVLSAAKGKERRQAIRDTWAKEGGVFFLVAGPWKAVKEEFDEYGDLIWLDFEENYRSITEKTASFFYLVDKVTSKLGLDYTYAAKVDDDTYVAQDRMLARLEVLGRQNGSPMEFWGRCGAAPIIRDPENQWYVSRDQYPEENYPVYCQGGGYALSKKFVHCAASEGHIAAIRYFDFEDVYVGLLAERCGIDTTFVVNDKDLMRQHRSGWRPSETQGEEQNIQQHSRKVNSSDSWLPEPDMARRIIQHNVFNADDMRGFHASYLDHKANGLTSVKEGDVVNYYFDEHGIGWLEGTVVSVSGDEESGTEVSVDFGARWGRVDGIAFDESYSGRWSRKISNSLMKHYVSLDEGSSIYRVSSANLERMKSVTSELELLTAPYYVYDNEAIDQAGVLGVYRDKGFLDPGVTQYDHIWKDHMAETAILNALKDHHSRVDDPSKAQFFVVPTPITEIALRGCKWEGCNWFDNAFDALEQQPSFKEHLGNNHVLIAASWLAFNHRFEGIIPALSRNYRRLRNITVAHHYDPYGIQGIERIAKGYETLYENEVPVTRSFSVGLGFDKAFDFREPTYENFENSKYFLFYHSRDTTSQRFSFQSTKYRDAPLNSTVVEAIPESSIGGATTKEQWISDFRSSQFCLVVRGDTPHSHAFLYSIRAGCIPVLVSDNYQEYAGPLKSSLAMKDFSIFINEEDFLRDPLKELLQLLAMGKKDIENLLGALAMAQRVIFPDHPYSLFVPAFLRELQAAQERPPPLPDAIVSSSDISDTSITIQKKEIGVRYAKGALSTLSNMPKGESPNIVVAVMTKAHRARQRRAIRNSWKKGQKLVFVTFNGNWENIEKEFMEEGDMVWAQYADITRADKALLALSFVDSYITDYDYILKINDSGCAFLDAAKSMLVKNPQSYWGLCPQPSADLGRNFGYFISKKLNKCMLQKEMEGSELPQHDGFATQQLANECEETCNNTGWEWLGDPAKKDLWFMDDNVEEDGGMARCYWNFMLERKIGEWAEG